MKGAMRCRDAPSRDAAAKRDFVNCSGTLSRTGKDAKLKNRKWVLAKRPDSDVGDDELELQEEILPDLVDGQILVRNIYLSLDPTNRIWMSDREQYLPPVELGNTMRGNTIGVVEHSRSDRFKQGDIVSVGD